MVCKIFGSQQLSCNNDRDGNGKKANVLGSVSTDVGDPYQASKRDQIKMRNYMDRRVTPPKRITSPTWGPS